MQMSPANRWSQESPKFLENGPVSQCISGKGDVFKQPLFDDTARQALNQATKGILRKVNSLALTALRLAASRKKNLADEATLLDAIQEAFL